MSIQRTFSCAKDVQLVHAADGRNGGVGAGNVISVGQTSSGARTRTQFEFGADWSGGKSVAQALLRLKVSDNCGSPGSAVKFWVEKVTAGFKEGSYADTCGVGATNEEKWPGVGETDSTTTDRVKYEGTPDDGDVISVDITALAEVVRAAGEKKLRLRLIAADATTGYDETNANRYVGFWSREKGNDGAGYKPRIEVVLDDAYAPDAPADVTPATTNYQAQGEAPTRVDTTFTVRGRFTEQEVAGKPAWLAASQFQLWTKYATDDGSGNVTGGTKLLDTIKSSYDTGALDLAHPVTTTAPVGTEIRGRVRVQNNRGRWGPWTRLAAMRVIPNNRPTAPTDLTVDVAPGNPTYGGRHHDPDKGSTVSAVETQVVVESAAGVEMVVNTTSRQPGDPTGLYSTLNGSGAQTIDGGGNVWSVSHSGRSLNAGERPKRRHRTVDQFGAVGDFSAWRAWVVGSGALPTVIPDSGTKQDTLTPQIGAAYIEDISGLIVEAYARNDLASRLLWQPPEKVVSAGHTSYTIQYGTDGSGAPLAGSTDLQWGQLPWVRTRVRVRSTGALTDWTDLSQVWINALPSVPTLSIAGSALGDDGVLRVGSLAPRIEMPFADVDLPDDAPSKQIAKAKTSGGVTLWSATSTSGIEDFADVPTSAGLAWETPYIVTGQYADSSGELGPTGQLAFTTHRPPSIALGTAVDVNDPTPTLEWAATFYGDADQLGYAVAVVDVTGGIADQVYDSGFIEDDSADSFDVPAYVLLDGHDYQATITVTDTLGISAVLNGVAIVAFSGEAAFELTATAALTVTDALPADSFTRTETDGWGISTSGSLWEILASPADFDTTGTTGTIVLPAAARSRKARLVGPNYDDITAVVKVKSDKLAVGAVLYIGLGVRAVDLGTHYSAALRLNTDQTVDLQIVINAYGDRSVMAQYRTALTHVAADSYWIKLKALTETFSSGGGHSSTGTTLSAKAWKVGDAEPGAYGVTTFNATPDLLVPSSVLLLGIAGSGITNAPVTLTFDDLSSSTP